MAFQFYRERRRDASDVLDRKIYRMNNSDEIHYSEMHTVDLDYEMDPGTRQ